MSAIHVAEREHSRTAAGSHFVDGEEERRAVATIFATLDGVRCHGIADPFCVILAVRGRIAGRISRHDWEKSRNESADACSRVTSRISSPTSNMLRPSRLVTYMENYRYDRAFERIHSRADFSLSVSLPSIDWKKSVESSLGVSRSSRLSRGIDHYRATVAFLFCFARATGRSLISRNKSARGNRRNSEACGYRPVFTRGSPPFVDGAQLLRG